MRLRGSGGDASDDLIEVTAIQGSPQALLFVEDDESAGGALIEGAHSVSERGVFGEQLRGKGIEERSERLAFEYGLADWQPTPKIAGASDGLDKQVAKRRERTGNFREEGTADLPEADSGASADTRFVGAVLQERTFAEEVAFTQDGEKFRFRSAWVVLQDFYLAFFDDAEGTRRFALAVNEIAWAVIGVEDLSSGIGIEETEIAREEHVP
jgi:hypothetical protein